MGTTVRPGRVLVVEPSSSGLGYLQAARDLGRPVVAVSADDDDRRIPDAHRRFVDELVVVDTNDDAAVTAAVRAAHAADAVAAVVPGFEFYVPAAASAAAAIGAPGLPPASAAVVRDKAQMRRRLADAGLRVPRFAVASSPAEVLAAGAHVGYPAVLKPVASAGSVHVTRVDDPVALAEAYGRLLADRRPDFGRLLDPLVLVEEYLAGPEYSVEGFVAGGVHLVAVTEKRLGPEPTFVEIGHLVPAALGAADRSALSAYVTEVVRAVDLAVGAFHAEVRLTEAGPVLIEIAARLGGDHIPDLVELATGVSLPRAALLAHLGWVPSRRTARSWSPRRSRTPAGAAGILFLTGAAGPPWPVAGVVDHERYDDQHHGDATADGNHSVVDNGGRSEGNDNRAVVDDPTSSPDRSRAVPILEDFRSRTGHVVLTARDRPELGRRWAQLRDALGTPEASHVGPRPADPRFTVPVPDPVPVPLPDAPPLEAHA